MPRRLDARAREQAAEHAALIAQHSDLLPENWPALMLDLLLQPDQRDSICIRYRTSPEEVCLLMDHNAAFQQVAREMQAKVAGAGADEAFMLRAQIIAESMLPELSQLGRSRTVSPAVKLKAIENLMMLAGHTAKGSKKEPAAGTTGMNMIINFGPGVPPLSGAPNRTMTIEPIKTGDA